MKPFFLLQAIPVAALMILLVIVLFTSWDIIVAGTRVIVSLVFFLLIIWLLQRIVPRLEGLERAVRKALKRKR